MKVEIIGEKEEYIQNLYNSVLKRKEREHNEKLQQDETGVSISGARLIVLCCIIGLIFYQGLAPHKLSISEIAIPLVAGVIALMLIQVAYSLYKRKGNVFEAKLESARQLQARDYFEGIIHSQDMGDSTVFLDEPELEHYISLQTMEALLKNEVVDYQIINDNTLKVIYCAENGDVMTTQISPVSILQNIKITEPVLTWNEGNLQFRCGYVK